MPTSYGFTPIDGEARRQFINARDAFTATRAAEREASDFEGNMFWRIQKGREYLIRTSRRGAQTSLGPRTAETEVIHDKFHARKVAVTERVEHLRKKMGMHEQLNRVRLLERVDATAINILNSFSAAGLDDNFLVIGTNALFGYEASAGVRIEPEHLATEDLDILWDNRKQLTLATREKLQPSGLLGILKSVDKSFELKSPTELFTAVNKHGYQVDLLRRAGPGSGREPDRLSQHVDDFWAIKAKNIDWLLSAPKFQSVIVGDNGVMAQMTTVDPRAFALFKMWMSAQADRDPVKKYRDVNQAKLVIKLIEQYLPHLSFDELVPFPAALRAAVSSFMK